jgi:hypothetical protein
MAIITNSLKYKTSEHLAGFDWEKDYADTLHWLHNQRYLKPRDHVCHDVVLLMVAHAPQWIKQLSIKQTIERKYYPEEI